MSDLRKRLEQISMLDFDDLVVLTLLYEGCSCKFVSTFLKLTPPAISHRLNKYMDVFGADFFIKQKNHKILSLTGHEVAQKAKKVLCMFLQEDDSFMIKAMNTKAS